MSNKINKAKNKEIKRKVELKVDMITNPDVFLWRIIR